MLDSDMKWRKLARFSGLALVAGLGVLWMLKAFEHSQVYHPDRLLRADASKLARPFEEAHFAASDGVKLHGWYFPSTNGVSAPVFLFCHGNAGNIGDRLDAAAALLETGAAVFLFDYRGFGRSEGRPSEQGTYLDAHAAYGWLIKRGHTGGRVVLFGESLGGGVASELAAGARVGGLILQSTFTSLVEVGTELFPWLPVRWISSIRYDTCARLPLIQVPVLIMHSREDDLIRYAHAERNYAAARAPKLLVELQGGHNEALLDRAAFVGGVSRLLEACAAGAPPLTP